jgi:signal transduction histidine kinase
MKIKLSPRRALVLFLAIVVVVFGQAVWWVIFMARLVGDKVRIAEQLGGSSTFVEMIHQQEIRTQVMLGSEGVFFLILILIGAWMIYRALVTSEDLKHQHQNFLMAVTHELKTPLASLRIYLDTLQSPKIADEKKQQIVPKMKLDIFRLEKMVEDILEAGRFERHEYTLSPVQMSFSHLVEEAIEEIDRIPKVVPRRIEKEIEPDVIIDGDSFALRRAITAVLENSLKYHNGDQVELKVTLRATDGYAVLTVADRGTGLSENDSELIFERFYRVGDEMTRKAPGTGLGLYLCREIIRAHGGEISARSEGPGKGTEFTITLRRRVTK